MNSDTWFHDIFHGHKFICNSYYIFVLNFMIMNSYATLHNMNSDMKSCI